MVDLPPGSEPATHLDPRLPGMRLPKGKSSFKVSQGPTPHYNDVPESLAFATVVQLSRLIKARKLTSTALTEMYLERLKRFDPVLHCVITLTEELALDQARRADLEIAAGQYRGPLHGIPWGVKDLLATRGIRTTWGAKLYENQVFDFDATVVQRLEAAGAVLVAKLAMGELATGDVWFGGKTRNPWNPEEGAAGSSAGPGSATAAGLVGFSIGTETLGSIVSPCVRNGVTGLRPTYGRVSRHGAMALCWTLDKIGPMCRSVEDCALVFHAIQGPDGKDPSVVAAPFRWDPAAKLSELKVGVDAAAFDRVMKGNNEGQKQVFTEVLATLRRLGVELRPLALPTRVAAYGMPLVGTILTVEAAAAFQKLTASGQLATLADQSADGWPNTFRVGSTVPAVDYLNALRVRRRLQQEIHQALGDVDCFVSPPFTSGTQTNVTGHPTLITRCGMLNGVPQSIEFTGALYREEAILRLALAYEQATHWHQQWPDIERLLRTER